MRKTYKVIYTVTNQPGRKVMLVEAYNEIDAHNAAYKEHGCFGSFNPHITVWEVKEL